MREITKAFCRGVETINPAVADRPSPHPVSHLRCESTLPLQGYGMSPFESGGRHFFGLLSRIPDRTFRDSSKVAAVIPYSLDNIQGITMRCGEGFQIGYFGDVRRQRAGATLFERVVETGSLVLRQVGSDRRGEMTAQRFLASKGVTHQEILVTAGQRTGFACAGRRIVAAQDTTEINFKDRDRARKGLGPA